MSSKRKFKRDYIILEAKARVEGRYDPDNIKDKVMQYKSILGYTVFGFIFGGAIGAALLGVIAHLSNQKRDERSAEVEYVFKTNSRAKSIISRMRNELEQEKPNISTLKELRNSLKTILKNTLNSRKSSLKEKDA